ncbi:MAG: hypothetical protein U5R31_02695 [Acidimicrobiia bacterium]|nr:hypothetical protein [Acidimicrobiia bacterium]
MVRPVRFPDPGVAPMDRPSRFEDHRFLGDKRTQVVYDLDGDVPQELIDDLMSSEQYLAFAPDTLAEARNRGYRLHRAG